MITNTHCVLVLSLKKEQHFLNFLAKACSPVLSKDCRAKDCRGGGQLCSNWGSTQQRQAAWRVLSLYFTAPLFGSHTLCHSEPDRIFTMFWAPHHCNSELIWKASRIFYFFWWEQVKAICICFSLEDFTGQLRQPAIEHAKESFPLRHHPLPFVSPSFWLYFSKISPVQYIRTIYLLSVRNGRIK